MKISKQALREYLENNPEKQHQVHHPENCVVAHYCLDNGATRAAVSPSGRFVDGTRFLNPTWLRDFIDDFDRLAPAGTYLAGWEVITQLGDHLKGDDE